MQQLGERIKQIRKEKGMSQSVLAQKVGLSYAQIGRYETKGVQPSADALKSIADVLGVSPDFLLYGSTDQRANSSLSDSELIQQFKAVEQMNEDDKNVIKQLIDAFITKRKIQQLAS